VESFPFTYQFLVVTEMGKVGVKLLPVPPLVVGLLPERIDKAVDLVPQDSQLFVGRSAQGHRPVGVTPPAVVTRFVTANISVASVADPEV
jgi:hypothetical protein